VAAGSPRRRRDRGEENTRIENGGWRIVGSAPDKLFTILYPPSSILVFPLSLRVLRVSAVNRLRRAYA
jgi:hypothetical protein